MGIYIHGMNIPKDREQYHRVTIYGNGQVIIDHETYCEEAEAIPAADVQAVVYCKDCIHRPYSTEPGKTSGFAVEAPDRECKCPCFNPDDGWYSWIPDDYFFCGNGERRGAKMGGDT